MAAKVGSAECVTSTVEQRRNKEQHTFYLYAIEKLSQIIKLILKYLIL